MAYSKRYYRAIDTAQTILEGKSVREAAEEMGVNRNTITRDIQYLLERARKKEHYELALRAKRVLIERSCIKNLPNC